MMLAIGPFAVIEDSLGDLPVNYWVYPEDTEDARWIFAKTPRMIAFYADLFDYPYPWAKYDQVTTPHVGGGAEATSATILGDGVIHDRRAEQDFSWERVIAHEIAHQWWGDLITLREWSHTWLNESFGTYSDYLWTRHESGDDEGAWALLGKKNAYLREAHTRYVRPIVFNRYEKPHDNFDSHTYPKGACILHQLRFLLGDEPFFRALSTFLHEHAFEPVDTHDFMKTREGGDRPEHGLVLRAVRLPSGPPGLRGQLELGCARPGRFDLTRGAGAGPGSRRSHLPDAGADRHRHRVGEEGGDGVAGERAGHLRLPEPGGAPPGALRRGQLAPEGVDLREERGGAALPGRARTTSSAGSGRCGSWGVSATDPGVAGQLAATVRDDPFWAVRLAAVETLAP